MKATKQPYHWNHKHLRSAGLRPGSMQIGTMFCSSRCEEAPSEFQKKSLSLLASCYEVHEELPRPRKPRIETVNLCESGTITSPRRGNNFPLSLGVLPFGNSEFESQRDSVLQPRVATKELPWVNGPTTTNPNGVAASPCFSANLNSRKALSQEERFLPNEISRIEPMNQCKRGARKSSGRGNNFSLSSGERAGVRASVAPTNSSRAVISIS